MRKTISIAFILFATSLSAQPLMTLEDALALGLKNSYSIQIARNQAEAASNNQGQGLAGLLPTLSATGSYSQADNELETDPPPATVNSDVNNLTAELSLNWTLFDGFRMFINRSMYRELARQGEYQARDQIEETIVAISKAYLNLVQQEQLLMVARDTRDVSESRLDRERVRRSLGGASSTDFLRSQVGYNADQSILLDRELQVTVARQQLNILLGQDPATNFEVATEIEIPDLPRTHDELYEAALQNNSHLKAAELRQKVARRQVQSARSAFLPRLNAFARYGIADQTVNSDAGPNLNIDMGTKNTGTTVGLSLSFNLFNGTRDRVQLSNAKIDAINQSLALRDARNRLKGLVQERYDTYLQRIELVTLQEQNIASAEQNLSLQRERFELGSSTSLEFRDAQVSLVLARTSVIQARYQARIARLEIEQLVGGLQVHRP
jgi:outer membrane protein